MENSHRLFVCHVMPENTEKNNSVSHDLRWGYAMDVAIATAVLAMHNGLDDTYTNFLYSKFYQLLPKYNEVGFTESESLNDYERQCPQAEKPWSAHNICDFILALAHRDYAIQYNSEKWVKSKFKSVPVGLPRTRNRTLKARNYTPHTISRYRLYAGRLRMGLVSEKPILLKLSNGSWFRVEVDKEIIELTETRTDHWLHTRISTLPDVWQHIDELLSEVIQLDIKLSSEERMDSIMGLVAQMHWWISHGMPYRRGSAAIGDMLSKVVLQYHGVSTPCWKKGVAPDLEALCTSLDEYIVTYKLFFIKQPVFLNRKRSDDVL